MESTTSKAFGLSASSVLVFLASCIGLLLFLSRHRSKGGRTTLRDPIPGLFNTVQFVFNNHRFIRRVQDALLRGGHSLVRFHLGPKEVYIVAGSQNIKAVFSHDLVHEVTNQEQMTRYALPTLYKMNAEEVRRWENDRSGVTKVPIPGTEDTPTQNRLWYTYEHIYMEYIGKPQFLKPLVSQFGQDLVRALERYPTDKWTTVSAQRLCRDQVGESAINTMFGPYLLESNPDFLERFWAFDEQVFKLVLGLPRWMDPGPSKAHDRYVFAIEKWMNNASAGFDWHGGEAKADWEPRFGGRAVRELYKWMKETEWRGEVIAATLGALAFALNSNSIPTTTWMIMEIIRDPSLLGAVRDEVATVISTDLATGKRTLDSRKLVALPLLQSIWTETLRLRINFNIMRDVKQPITLDGHTIPRGSLLQAPMMVAHYDEAVWGTTDHAASEFWAERHIRYTHEDGHVKRSYAMAGRPTSYFPFGGGANICPGRQLAKFESLITLALFISQFDIELLEWTRLDGSHSYRGAESDLRYSGAGAMPPDRDMKIRCRRRNDQIIVTTN